jgi:hypothetical protein
MSAKNYVNQQSNGKSEPHKKPKIMIDEYEVKVFSPKKQNESPKEKFLDKPKILSPLPKSPTTKLLTKKRDSPAKKKVKKNVLKSKLFQDSIPKFFIFDVNEKEMKEDLVTQLLTNQKVQNNRLLHENLLQRNKLGTISLNYNKRLWITKIFELKTFLQTLKEQFGHLRQFYRILEIQHSWKRCKHSFIQFHQI